jgi:DNA-binding helix-hairpin-helix protein with protein kinase domain
MYQPETQPTARKFLADSASVPDGQGSLAAAIAAAAGNETDANVRDWARRLAAGEPARALKRKRQRKAKARSRSGRGVG